MKTRNELFEELKEINDKIFFLNIRIIASNGNESIIEEALKEKKILNNKKDDILKALKESIVKFQICLN